MDRQTARKEFIHSCGLGHARQQDLPVDASARSYHRLTDGQKSFMLMDDPSGGGDIEAFVRLAKHLSKLGFSTPDILQQDLIAGFLLLEDFGDQTYRNLMTDGYDQTKLYGLAVEVLAHLHDHPQSTKVTVPPYDLDFMLMEVGLLTDWYWPELKSEACPATVRDDYIQAWTEIHDGLPYMPNELVIRDFHVDNLMLLDGREGIQACGILDFQSALMGYAPYDLMSLLEDARRDVPQELVSQMLDHYFDLRPAQDRETFMAWFHFLGAQRHAKILGGFMRTYRRDGKDGYLQYMPRVGRQLSNKLKSPAMKPVSDWFQRHLPEILDQP